MAGQRSRRMPPKRVLILGIGVVAGLVALTASGSPGSVLLYVAYAGAGTFLAARRPGHPIPWVLVLIGAGLAAAQLPVPATRDQALAGDLAPTAAVALWSNGVGFSLVFLGMVVLMLAFPDGRLPGGRARPPALALIAGSAVLTLLIAHNPVVNVQLAGAPATIDVPNPFSAFPSSLGPSIPGPDTLFPVTFGFVAGSLVVLLVRYRASRGLPRLQYRWLVWSLVLVVVTSTTWAMATIVVPVDTIGMTLALVMLSYAAVPVAITAAIVRYRLFDIDRVISRSVAWGIATAAIVALFATAVLALQGLLEGVTQGEVFAVAASTLLAAALFQPLRRQVQAVVDRRFDRPRLELERTLGRYAERVQQEVDLATIERDIVATVDAALRPTAALLWIRHGSSPHGRPAPHASLRP